MLRETRREEKVGRVVSLSIDLQGISELDRDAVIASCKKREKDFVYVQRCITCAKVSPRIPRNFLIRCILDASKCKQGKEGLKKNSFRLRGSCIAICLAFTYLSEGF